ncbi:MAG: helix-turn-helix domain-containing protein [Omnitrophica bacterium]|nr:helix-turn-helix domain-containing protein [Candidatus Omnitrophota bacterium]
MEDAYMTIKELANYLRVKQSTVYNWINSDRVPASKVVGQWRFRRSEIDEWIKNSNSNNNNKNRQKNGQKIEDSGRFSFQQRSLIGNSQQTNIEKQKYARHAINNSGANQFFVERRKDERIFIKEGEMFIKIIVNFPERHEFVGQIIDMTSSGLSFKLKSEKEGILPGTPLKNIVVANDRYQKKISNSYIRYCNPIDENNPNDFKVGLEFDIAPFEHSIIRRKLLGSYKIRMPRYGNWSFTLLKWKIAFVYKWKNIISDKLINFSKFGIAFKIDKQSDFVFRKGDVLLEFSLVLESDLIYTGKTNIVDLQEHDDNIIVRCSLDGYIDLENVFSLARGKIESKDIVHFISNIEKTKPVETIFKAEVADLRFFLEKTKEKLDVEEKEIVSRNDSIDREHYHRVILDGIFNSVSTKLNEYFSNIWQIVRSFEETKYNLHKRYFQQHLLHLFLLSPFGKRSFVKPLGHAGDYMMIDMLYNNPDEGESIFAKLINRHAYYQNASKAVRNRIPILQQKFNSLLKNRPNQTVNIMSVGSGSAKEIREIVKDNNDIERCIFTLVEADEEAIFYSREKIIDLFIQKGKKVKINFINKAVDQLVKEKELVEKIGKYDLIYSIGLFDYFTLNVSKRLTTNLYNFLAPKGKLIIGNFSHLINENKVYMDFVLEWFLFYRSKEEMLKFTEKLEGPKKIYFESEDTGITNFLIIEK